MTVKPLQTSNAVNAFDAPAQHETSCCLQRHHAVCSDIAGYTWQMLPFAGAAGAEGAEDGTAPLRSALFLVFISSVTFLSPAVTLSPCKQVQDVYLCMRHTTNADNLACVQSH